MYRRYKKALIRHVKQNEPFIQECLVNQDDVDNWICSLVSRVQIQRRIGVNDELGKSITSDAGQFQS
ncbi:hypothetical protein M3J09_012565 [Ascochyta lentis]